jgi:hypothetical protein
MLVLLLLASHFESSSPSVELTRKGFHHMLAKCDDQYFCHLCYDRLPAFSDSFFLNISVGNNNTDFDVTLENTSNTPNSTSGVNKTKK